MAQVHRIEFIDDYDGKPLDVEDLNKVSFVVEGVEYRLELREANYQRFLKDMTKWTDKAEKVGKVAKVKPAPKRPVSRSVKLAEMREWARGHGYEVSDRGRLAAEIEEAYVAANG